MNQHSVQALPSGAQIGVYEIKDVISRDWYSILYRAWNEHLNTMVVLKEYLPGNYVIRDEDGTTVRVKSDQDTSVFEYGMEKFLELAERLTDAQHPNIVNVHNVLSFNGTAYLAMEFVKGTPLSSLSSYPDSELKQIFRSLLNGLQAAHDKKIIHGDITPSNILIQKNGEPVLVNFASANIALSDHCKRIQQTFSSGFTYTKNYHPDDLSSFSSDLYSLGASMFFSLTGSEPASFIDRQEMFNNNDTDSCQAVLEGVDPKLSEELSEATLSMLNLSPEQRPQSAYAVLTKLDQEFDKKGNEKGKILKADTEKKETSLLLPGLAGFVGLLLAGAFWFFIQKTPESTDLISDAGKNQSVQKPMDVVVKEGSKGIENFIQEELTGEPGTTVKSGADQNTHQPIAEIKEIESIEKVVQDEENEKSVDEVATAEFNKQESGKLAKNEIIEANTQELAKETESNTEVKLSEGSQNNLTPDNVESELTIEEKHKISQFLLAAKKNVGLFNLTTPPDNNAYDQYHAVLSIDENNAQAIDGLQKIFNIYTGLVEKSLSKGDFNNARVYIKRAKAIQPDAPELLILRKKIRAMKQQREEEYILKGQGFVAQITI